MTSADELRAAAAKLSPSSPAVATHTVGVRLHPTIVEALEELLDAAAKMAREYPDLAREHDRPTCDDYACDVMGHALTVARAVLGSSDG